MFGIGTGELLLILVIAMLVVGPERMVDYARRGGRLLAKIRSQTDEVTKDFRQALQADAGGDPDNPLTTIAQLKSEAEGAARDLQGAFTGAPATAKAPDKPAPKAAAPVPTAPPATAPEAAPATPTATAATAEEAATELAVVELVDDDEALELGGPVLVEDAAEAEATDEGQQ